MARMNSGFDKQKLMRGFRSFAAITVAAFVLLGILTTDTSTWRGLAQLRPLALPMVIALVFISWFTTALKVQILANSIGSRVGVWACFRAHMANMFLSAVTPFQTGGGAAQIYVLWREGLSISRATAASLVGALITIVFLFFTGIAVLLLRPSLVENVAVRVVTVFVIAVFAVVFFLFWVAFFRPQLASWVVRTGARIVEKVPFLPKDKVWRLHDRFAQELTDLVAYLRSYLTEGRTAFLKAIPLGAISIVANCMIAYAIMFGMRLNRDPGEVLLAQALIYFIVYFSPSPGGSGVAEAGGASLMAALIPTQQIAVYVVLWRFFTYLSGVGFGSIVIIGILRRQETTAIEDVPPPVPAPSLTGAASAPEIAASMSSSPSSDPTLMAKDPVAGTRE
jgi:uncharacterized protein (TIRG00374 family)